MCDSSLSAGGVSAMQAVRPLTGGGVELQQQQQQQQQQQDIHKENTVLSDIEDPDAKEAELIERISNASELMRKHLADIKTCDETLQSLVGAVEQGGNIGEETRRRGLELADRKVDLADQGYKAIDTVICELDVELGRLEAALREDHFSLETVAAVKRRRLKEIERKIEQERREIEMALAERSEPLYCVCRSVSFGDMVACDNENCAVEWFHFSCVNLKETPKGTWYCPACRPAMEAARPKRKRKKSIYSSRRKRRAPTS